MVRTAQEPIKKELKEAGKKKKKQRFLFLEDYKSKLGNCVYSQAYRQEKKLWPKLKGEPLK
eukprot:6467980-Amphidinium_carterae.1